MYQILTYKNFIFFQTANDRDELNEKADYTYKYLNGYCPEDGIPEEKCYDDKPLSYDKFIKQNPKYKNYTRVNLKEFRDKL